MLERLEFRNRVLCRSRSRALGASNGVQLLLRVGRCAHAVASLSRQLHLYSILQQLL